MLSRLEKLAAALAPFRALAYLVGIGCAALALYALLGAPQQQGDLLLIPGLLGTLWALLFVVLIGFFRRVPAPADAGDPFLRRLKARCHRFLYIVLGVLFIVLSLTLLGISFRLVSVWVANP